MHIPSVSPPSLANPFSAVDCYGILSPQDVSRGRVPGYPRALTSFFENNPQRLVNCGGVVADFGPTRTCDGYCNDDAKVVQSTIRGCIGEMQVIMALDPDYPVTRSAERDMYDHMRDIEAAKSLPGGINGLALQWHDCNEEVLGTEALLSRMQKKGMEIPVLIDGANQSSLINGMDRLMDQFPSICAMRIDQVRFNHMEAFMELLTKRNNLSVFYGQTAGDDPMEVSDERRKWQWTNPPVRITGTLQRFPSEKMWTFASHRS